MQTQHPATLYGFILSLAALIAVSVLAGLHIVSGGTALGIIAATGGVGVGGALGIAVPNAARLSTATDGTEPSAVSNADATPVPVTTGG